AGVSAATRPAITAAGEPIVRRTIAIRITTVPTPISASGRRTLHELSPNNRTERPITIVERGGLSTVMKLLASIEPKNQADQLCDAASAAAEQYVLANPLTVRLTM